MTAIQSVDMLHCHIFIFSLVAEKYGKPIYTSKKTKEKTLKKNLLILREEAQSGSEQENP